MPILTEEYRGYEIRIRVMGPPPHTAQVRRLDSPLYRPEIDEGASEEAVRADAMQRIDSLIGSAGV